VKYEKSFDSEMELYNKFLAGDTDVSNKFVACGKVKAEDLDETPEGRALKSFCALPDEVKFSSVKFQFLLTADDQSFTVGYFDQGPWLR